jgi:hypothetical protein
MVQAGMVDQCDHRGRSAVVMVHLVEDLARIADQIVEMEEVGVVDDEKKGTAPPCSINQYFVRPATQLVFFASRSWSIHRHLKHFEKKYMVTTARSIFW